MSHDAPRSLIEPHSGDGVDYVALWRNPPRGASPTPPQLLAAGVSKAELQDKLFWQDWPCMQGPYGPDPQIYGDRSPASRWCNWMAFGPLPIRVTEPSYMFTASGHCVELEETPYVCLFDGTDCTSEIVGSDKPYTVPYGGVEGTPAPVMPLPIQDYWMGRKTYRYIVPVPVLFKFEAETKDGLLPVPVGYSYPSAYPSVASGKVVGMHILSQVEQTTFGYFDIPLPPVPSSFGSPESGPPNPALYESYFPVVLQAWPQIRHMVKQYGDSIGFDLDKWVLACSTKDAGSLISDDPFPCVLEPFLDAFTSEGQVVDGDKTQAALIEAWFSKHPDQGPKAPSGSYRKWKYENELASFLVMHQ